MEGMGDFFQRSAPMRRRAENRGLDGLSERVPGGDKLGEVARDQGG